MNLQIRFNDVRALIHHLEEERGEEVEQVISDTKVVTVTGNIYSIRGDCQTVPKPVNCQTHNRG